MSSVTIRTLAQHVNLSIGTVSKALSDSYEISAETKQKVLEAAKQLNYQPNAYASSLRRKKSHTIAVVVPEVADSFFSEAIKGIEAIAQQQGYHVLVYLSHESYSREVQIMQQFKNGRVDGLLMSVSGETCTADHLLLLEEENIPVVLFDRAMPGVKAARVVTNDRESCYVATRHLLERCNKPVYLSVSNLLDINNQRMQGFIDACQQHDCNEYLVVDCPLHDAGNFGMLNELIAQHKPDAIVAPVEKLVVPIYTICQQHQINIPQQTKVVAYANLSTAAILNPSLSTVTQPAYQMGQQAALILFKALNRPNYRWYQEMIVLPSMFNARESSA